VNDYNARQREVLSTNFTVVRWCVWRYEDKLLFGSPATRFQHQEKIHVVCRTTKNALKYGVAKRLVPVNITFQYSQYFQAPLLDVSTTKSCTHLFFSHSWCARDERIEGWPCLSDWTDLDEILYLRYVTGGYPAVVVFNFLHSIIPT
jgi:hypothetical protein